MKAAPSPVIDVSINAPQRRRPDGKLHDAFSMTTFRVKAGQTVILHVDNTDNTRHSIFSPTAGVLITIAPRRARLPAHRLSPSYVIAS